MRMNLACVVVLAVAGCTRMNPAFNADDETAGETRPESTTELGTESAEGSDLPECSLDNPGQELRVRVPDTCGEEDYERSMVVNKVIDSNHLEVIRCNDWTCGVVDPVNGCPDENPTQLIVDPLPVGDILMEAACLRVVAKRRPSDSGNDCEFQSVTIWEYVDGEFEPVLIARGALDIPLASTVETRMPVVPATPGVPVRTEPAQSCECDMFDCCGGGTPTALEHFVIGPDDTIVSVGAMPEDIQVAEWDMVFHGLAAWDSGSCGDGPSEQAWGVLRPG